MIVPPHSMESKRNEVSHQVEVKIYEQQCKIRIFFDTWRIRHPSLVVSSRSFEKGSLGITGKIAAMWPCDHRFDKYSFLQPPIYRKSTTESAAQVADQCWNAFDVLGKDADMTFPITSSAYVMSMTSSWEVRENWGSNRFLSSYSMKCGTIYIRSRS